MGTILRTSFVLSLLLFFSSNCFADELLCSKLGVKAEVSGIQYYPAMEAKIVGARNVYLYSSPDADCKIKGVFAAEGDYVTVYRHYKGWAHVMFATKQAEDFMGWLPESKIRILGPYGRNP